MSPQDVIPRELGLALLALVRFLACVRQSVSVQLVAFFELHVAQLALEPVSFALLGWLRVHGR